MSIWIRIGKLFIGGICVEGGRELISAKPFLGCLVGGWVTEKKIVPQADFVWLITAMQAYLMVLAENDPVNQGYWECTSSTDSPCQAIYELENLKDRKEEFCNMDASQWTWSHP